MIEKNKNPIWHCNIKEWLDRGLGNEEWKLRFPKTKVHHLSKNKSNHYPILLSTDSLECKSQKPFRFEQMWLTDPSFPNLVETSWKSSETIPSSSSSLSKFQQCLDFLTSRIIDWNKNHFGNLFQ